MSVLKLFAGKSILMYGLPIVLVALVASHAWVHHKGVVSERNRQDAQRLVQFEQAVKTMNIIAAEEIAQAQTRRVVFRAITREVAAHAASTAAVPCIDSIGMRILGAAAAGRATAEPDGGVP